jgi:hypothetical protein
MLISSNQLEACAALAAVCKIVTEDMIPAVIGDVRAQGTGHTSPTNEFDHLHYGALLYATN